MTPNERAPYQGRSTPRMVTQSTGWLMTWVAADATRRFETALAEVGLTAHQLGVLSVLQGGPQKQARLSEQLAVFQPVMVTLINELEERGWAVRHPHPQDRRAVEVHLTDAGAAKLGEAYGVLGHTENEIFAALDRGERQQLHDMLVRMTEIIE